MDQSKVTMDTPVTAEEMKTWEKEAVLEWIQRKKPKLLKGNNLKIFNETDFSGDAFLLSSCEFSQKSGLSDGVSRVLESLLKEVKGVNEKRTRSPDDQVFLIIESNRDCLDYVIQLCDYTIGK